jgi:hypothetical protein
MRIRARLIKIQSITGLSIITFLFFLFSFLFPDYFRFTTKVGTTSYNIANKWNCKFRYFDGGRQGWFTAKSDDAQLIYSISLECGTLESRLYDRNGPVITFSESNTTDTLSGFFKKGKRYRVFVNAQQATNGSFRFEMK